MAQVRPSESTAQPEWMQHVVALRRMIVDAGDGAAAKNLDRVEQALTSPSSVVVVDDVEAEVNDRRQLIRRLVRRHENSWRGTGTKPRFKLAQLMVMAALWTGSTSILPGEMIAWIATRFSYFGELIHNDSFTLPPSRRQIGARQSEHPTDGVTMQQALWEYDFPTTNGYHNFWAERVDLATSIQIPAGAGRIYLRHLLEKPRSGIFRFMDLPSELRASIYEMVFSFPRTGLRLVRDEWYEGHRQLRTRNRMLDADGPVVECGQKGWSFKVGKMSDILALLSVNRAINHEAMPYFYRINRFDLKNAEDASFFLRRMGLQRRRELRHLSFSVARESPGVMLRVLNLLAKCPGLRTLEIVVGDSYMGQEMAHDTSQHRHLLLLAGLMETNITLRKDSTTRLPELERFVNITREGIKARIAAPPALKRKRASRAPKSPMWVSDSDDEVDPLPMKMHSATNTCKRWIWLRRAVGWLEKKGDSG